MAQNGLSSIGIRLPGTLIERADRLAQSRNISRTEALRLSATIGLPLLEAGISPDIRRLILLVENLNLGVSLLLDKEHSDKLDKLAEVAEDHVSRFHG